MNASQRPTLIRADRIVDGHGEHALAQPEVLVIDGRFAAIGERDSLPVPTDAVVLDLAGRTLFPGLIDAHMHFFGVPSRTLHLRPTERESYRVLRAAAEAQAMLWAGITSARDLGSSVGPDLRRAIDEGLVPGPRLQAAGEFVATTAGTWEYTTLPLHWAQERDVAADGPDAMRAIVRRRVRSGATVIKLGLSKGAVGDRNRSWGHDPAHQVQAMTLEEARAAVDEAHIHGLRVSGHAIGDRSVNLGLDAGVDVIEHAHGITQETRARLAESRTLVGTTIAAMVRNHETFDSHSFSAEERRSVDLHLAQMQEDFSRSIEAGVRYVLGTDLIGPPTQAQHEAAREFAHLVAWGMPPLDAIVAGTLHGAEAMALDGEIGGIEVGMAADLIAVPRSPLDDITVLQHPSFVMHDGVVVRLDDHVAV